ncbi:MAG TPA: MarR family transcriptional regulator [Pseudomonadales bacterium]|nr:MarR family transcriptional regulator [Pseudomonadales bacterium]
MMKLLRTVLYLHHKLERASRTSEMSISQYRMLYHLKNGPRRAAQLAIESSIRKPSITSLMATLEGKGWITRAEDPDDRRALSIEITRIGTQAMKKFEAELQLALEEFLGDDAVADADEYMSGLYDLWNERRKVLLAEIEGPVSESVG